jgi:uncharacterized membrane protein YphA (DoxX/SURF4 family)
MKEWNSLPLIRVFREILLSRWTYFFVRLALALLFVYAGSIKLTDPKAFARVISHFDLLPEPLLPVVAVGLPAIEVLAGLALAFDRSAGLYGVSGLLLFFVAVLGFGVLYDLDIDCGCFGPEDLAEHEGLAHAFFRDLWLICAAAFLYWSRFVRGRRLCGQQAYSKSIQ